MSPVVNTEFPVNKNFQGNFLHFKKTLPSHSVFNLTLSYLNGFSSFFLESARNIIPDISASLEYFSSAGERFYFVINPVRGPLHQFPCLASNTSHSRSVSFSTRS